jgi:hypothetical protein
MDGIGISRRASCERRIKPPPRRLRTSSRFQNDNLTRRRQRIHAPTPRAAADCVGRREPIDVGARTSDPVRGASLPPVLCARRTGGRIAQLAPSSYLCPHGFVQGRPPVWKAYGSHLPDRDLSTRASSRSRTAVQTTSRPEDSSKRQLCAAS